MCTDMLSSWGKVYMYVDLRYVFVTASMMCFIFTAESQVYSSNVCGKTSLLSSYCSVVSICGGLTR